MNTNCSKDYSFQTAALRFLFISFFSDFINWIFALSLSYLELKFVAIIIITRTGRKRMGRANGTSNAVMSLPAVFAHERSKTESLRVHVAALAPRLK